MIRPRKAALKSAAFLLSSRVAPATFLFRKWTIFIYPRSKPKSVFLKPELHASSAATDAATAFTGRTGGEVFQRMGLYGSYIFQYHSETMPQPLPPRSVSSSKSPEREVPFKFGGIRCADTKMMTPPIFLPGIFKHLPSLDSEIFFVPVTGGGLFSAAD